MASRMDDVMNLCCEISARDELSHTWIFSMDGATKAGSGALIGALLIGPVGIFAGAAVGGLMGWLTSPEFKPVPQILMELTPDQKRQLYKDVVAALGNRTWKDRVHLFSIVMNNATLMKKVNVVLETFIKKIHK